MFVVGRVPIEAVPFVSLWRFSGFCNPLRQNSSLAASIFEFRCAVYLALSFPLVFVAEWSKEPSPSAALGERVMLQGASPTAPLV